MCNVSWVYFANMFLVDWSRKYLQNMIIGYAPKIPNKGDYARNHLRNVGPR